MSNLPCINLCAGTTETGNAVSLIHQFIVVSVYCADSWNGFDTIVVKSTTAADFGIYNWE